MRREMSVCVCVCYGCCCCSSSSGSSSSSSSSSLLLCVYLSYHRCNGCECVCAEAGPVWTWVEVVVEPTTIEATMTAMACKVAEGRADMAEAGGEEEGPAAMVVVRVCVSACVCIYIYIYMCVCVCVLELCTTGKAEMAHIKM